MAIQSLFWRGRPYENSELRGEIIFIIDHFVDTEGLDERYVVEAAGGIEDRVCGDFMVWLPRRTTTVSPSSTGQ